ncbi:MAG: class I SAM-dependent methyltransferase [Tepidisphaeraceae bacterium]
MIKDQWTAVDRYLTDLLVPPDFALDEALRASRDAGLPPINVAPNLGKLLHLLARMLGARNILEIGALGGYSTIWLARALPTEGRLITLEADPKHATVARASITRAGLSDVVELIEGRAIDTLPRLASEARGPALTRRQRDRGGQRRARGEGDRRRQHGRQRAGRPPVHADARRREARQRDGAADGGEQRVRWVRHRAGDRRRVAYRRDDAPLVLPAWHGFSTRAFVAPSA